MRHVTRSESWPIAGGFRIARGAKNTAEVVVVELIEGRHVGRGEAVPYARYGESIASVLEAIDSAMKWLSPSVARSQLQRIPAGGARNALDCALCDLEARTSGEPVWARLGFDAAPAPVETMRTVSIDSPKAMAVAAARLTARTLKVKVDGENDLDRIRAVHEAAPHASIVVDANESWSTRQLERFVPELGSLGVVLVEQPLRAGEDDVLSSMRGAVPFCADESFHDRSSFGSVVGRYDMINVKLDKTGGLTEAIAVMREAETHGLQSMVGCMVSTSLAIAPALLLASSAALVDLDGPLLLARDRDDANHDSAASVLRPSADLWGG